MGDFWDHAFESLGDNVSILGSVLEDVADNLNPFSDEFLSGNAESTATEVERQLALEQGRDFDPVRADVTAAGGMDLIRDAASATGDDVKAAAGSALSTAGKAAGGVLDAITNPWVIGVVGTLVLAVFAAPYVIPAVKAATT